MYCTQCGNPAMDRAAYCARCGAPLELLQNEASGEQAPTVSKVEVSRPAYQQSLAEHGAENEAPSSSTTELTNSERSVLKKVGFSGRFGASLVGFIGAALGVMTIVTPPSDPTILGAEVFVLFLVGMALAEHSRKVRSAVAWALERGTLTRATGVLRSLPGRGRTIDFGTSYIPLSKVSWPGVASVPDGTILRLSYAGPSLQAKPKVVVIRSNPPSFTVPAVLPLVNAP